MITRLITGEEILGEICPESNFTCYVIKNPTSIAAARNPKTDNVDIHMGPWLPLSAEKTVKINSSVVACQYPPVTEILNKYNTLFGSGIVIPNTSYHNMN